MTDTIEEQARLRSNWLVQTGLIHVKARGAVEEYLADFARTIARAAELATIERCARIADEYEDQPHD